MRVVCSTCGRRGTAARSAVLAIAAVALVGGGVWMGLYLGRPAAPTTSTPPSPAEAPKPAPPVAKKTPEPVGLEALYERVLPSVPVLTAMPLVGLGRGSGFLIAHDERLYIVTNRHVVNAAERGFTLSFHKAGSVSLRDALNLPVDRSALTIVHKTADLALLDVTDYRPEIGARRIRPLVLADPARPPKVLQEIWVVGHPVAGGGMALDNTATTGTISRVGEVPGFGQCIGITAPISQGNSGGPVLDKAGRVVGVTTFFVRGMDRGNFAVHVDVLRQLLTDTSVRMSPDEVAQLLKTPKELVQAEKDRHRITSEVLPEAGRIVRKLEQEGFHPLPWNEGRNVIFFRLDSKRTERRTFPVAAGRRYGVAVLSLLSAKLNASVDGGADGPKLTDVAREAKGRLIRVTAGGNGDCQVTVRNDGAEALPVIVLLMEK